MARFPDLRFWIDAWALDTKHLNYEETGIYITLIIMMWSHPNCRIPNDDKWLARHFRMTPREVEKKLRPLITEFCKKDRRFITQGRLKDEWDYRMRNSDNQRTRANTRWGKEKKSTPAMPSIPSLPNPKNKDSGNSLNDPVEKTVNGGDKPFLKSATIERAHEIAGQYDIGYVERVWREGGYAKKARNPDAAFLGFVRKHVKENPI